MGDRGRLVVPLALRDKMGWEPGAKIHFLETDDGIEVMDQDALLAYVQAQYAGLDLVTELLTERRAEAAKDLAEAEEIRARAARSTA